ncbi:MAG: hypothetical protein ACE5EA_09610 [Nitrospirota bacterium]
MSDKYKVIFSLSLLILFQISLSVPDINRPFIDGRQHNTYDNARFLLHAEYSNDNDIKDIRKISGLTNYYYDSDGNITRLDFYTHHPVLLPALFKIYTGIAGYGNWVPRSFILPFSIGITILLFLLLKSITNHLFFSWLSTLLFIVLPLNMNYQDVFKYEIVTSFFILLNFLLLFKRDKTAPYYRTIFLISFFFIFQTDWPAYLPGASIILFMYYKRKDYGCERLYLYAAIIACVSILINFYILFQLGWSINGMIGTAGGRINGHLSGISLVDWIINQYEFLCWNYSKINIMIFGALILFLLWKKVNTFNPLVFCAIVILVTVVLYNSIFRSGSYIHHYWQYYFGLSYILFLGEAFLFVKKDIISEICLKLLTIPAIILIFITFRSGINMAIDIKMSLFGTARDIAIIKTLSKKRRFILFSDGKSGNTGWWTAPHITLYADRIYKDSKIGGIAFIDDKKTILHPDSDVIVSLNRPYLKDYVKTYYQKRFALRQVTLEGCSTSFCFFSFHN